MCTMCIEYHFALLGKTAKGLFFSISLCISWKAGKRKRGFSFFDGKTFWRKLFPHKGIYAWGAFFRFHFQRRGALFRAFKYFRLWFPHGDRDRDPKFGVSSEKLAVLHCFWLPPLCKYFVIFLCLTFACVLHNTTTHNLYFHTEYQLKCLVNVVELNCVATSSRWVVNFERGR